jgi:hypothetical protein
VHGLRGGVGRQRLDGRHRRVVVDGEAEGISWSGAAGLGGGEGAEPSAGLRWSGALMAREGR